MAKKNRKLHNCNCDSCQRHLHSKIAKEHKVINRVLLGLDERNRRRFIGMLASQRGNVSEFSQIPGLSRNTIYRGQWEVDHPRHNPASGIRRRSGGRLNLLSPVLMIYIQLKKRKRQGLAPHRLSLLIRN